MQQKSEVQIEYGAQYHANFLQPGYKVQGHNGKVTLVDEIKRGGMGVVWRAVDDSGNLYALKLCAGSSSDETEKFNVRHELEVVANQRVTQRGSPNLAKFYHDGCMSFKVKDKKISFRYFLMEFVEGTDLSKMLSITPTDSVYIATKVLGALDLIHEFGTVHRDIKRENVMWGYDGRVVVLDMGISKGTDVDYENLTRDACKPGFIPFIGTLRMAAPEQLFGHQKSSPQGDVYQTGLLLHSLLSGREHAFRDVDRVSLLNSIERGLEFAPSQALTPQSKNRLSEADKAIVESLDDVVMRMIRPNPKDRFSSAMQAADALESVCETSMPDFYRGCDMLQIYDESMLEALSDSAFESAARTRFGELVLLDDCFSDMTREAGASDGRVQLHDRYKIQHGEKKMWTVGRKGTSCDIVIGSSVVSREHAKLSLSEEGITIEDQNSSGGTYVLAWSGADESSPSVKNFTNKHKIAPYVSVNVKPGDWVMFGQSIRQVVPTRNLRAVLRQIQYSTCDPEAETKDCMAQ